MKLLKSILTGAFWLLIAVLLVAPLGLIWQISSNEMAEYAAPEVPMLQETAVGDVVQAIRQDVQEYVIVSGIFTSTEYAYMELNARQASSIRWIVETGDEIQKGQVLGTYKNTEIISTVTGILVELNTYSASPYLRVQQFSPVVLETRVDERTLAALKSAEELVTESGEQVTLEFYSMQKNPDGTTDVRLSIDSDKFTYGQELRELRVLTGRVYRKTLVLPAKCIYQKNAGENEPWYARMVTEDGIFLMEMEVQIGYTNGDVVCISGVEEGAWFDSGYRAIVGG